MRKIDGRHRNDEKNECRKIVTQIELFSLETRCKSAANNVQYICINGEMAALPPHPLLSPLSSRSLAIKLYACNFRRK